jgi:membrane protein YqaA with SNARE-associated domain
LFLKISDNYFLVELFYFELFFVVFIANIMPAFAPPTWIILSTFKLKYNIDFIPLIFIGLLAAGLGRCVMYFYSKFFYKFLPEHKKQQIIKTKEKLAKKKKLIAFLIFLYSLGPLPSNIVFILSGLSSYPLLPVLSGFLLGRLLSYSFAVVTFDSFIYFLYEKAHINIVPYLDIVALVIAILLAFVDFSKIKVKWLKIKI